jgi:redox-sensitive bicupin YhaK (pirin superfamily)
MTTTTIDRSTEATTVVREAAHLLRGQATQDGAGVKLTRMLDSRLAELADPFLMLDEFRSDTASDYIAGFPPHPHRGFETVTLMFAGRMRHKDNQGNQGDLGPGSVQWMTAARGIVHEEMPQQEDGLMWGYQLWINLPAAMKMSEPGYQDIDAALIPRVDDADGKTVRVISGEYAGAHGPVKPRPTQPILLDVTLPAGAVFDDAVPQGHTVMLHGVAGEARVGTRGQPLQPRQLLLLGDGGRVRVEAGDAGAQFLLIAGKPLREPIAHYGPFVMNTQQELQQAFNDFRSGAF